jgi:tetratricopeptide (TPR) repeat protein/Cdc6-like AAA superfamily ATPase
MQEEIIIQRTVQVESLIGSLSNSIEQSKFLIRLIAGEAGTGKSTICQQFVSHARLKHPDIYIAKAFCGISSEFSLPYAPFKEILRSLLLLDHAAQEPQKTGKKILNFALKKTIEHAPDLIGNFIPGGAIIAKYGEEFLNELGVLDKFKKKPTANEQLESIDERKILMQYTEILQFLSVENPICIIIDDFQWADKASINMLYFMSRLLEGFPIFILIAYRSTEVLQIIDGHRHPFVQVLNEFKRHFGDVIIDLDELGEDVCKKLMDELLDSIPNNFTPQFRKELFEITGGNPLFVNEMVASLRDNYEIELINGIWTVANEIKWKQKPARIEGIIEERISQLEATALDLLSHASVQGNRFIAQVLSRTTHENEREVLTSLSRKLQKEYNLVREINCYRAGKNIVSQFQFSNYIFQHYLYEELSLSQKMLLHGDIAESLKEIFIENIDDVALDIARHYEFSGEPQKSIEYLIVASKTVMKISQFELAIDILTKALYLQRESLRPNKEVELEILSTLSTCKRIVLGWSHNEVVDLYNQTIQLGRELGKLEMIASTQFGMWAVYMNQMKLSKALEYATDYMESASEIDDRSVFIQANIALANTYFWMDNQKEAISCLVAIDQLNIDTANDALTHRFGQSPRSLILMFQLMCNHFAGNIENTQKALKLNLTYIEEVKHLYSKVIVLTTLTWYYKLIDETEKSILYANELVQLANKRDFQFYLGLGLMFQCAGNFAMNNWDTQFQRAQKLVFNTPEISLLKTEFEITHARYLTHQHNLAKAENILQQAQHRILSSEEHVSKAYICCELAKVLLLQGKIEQSTKAVKCGLQHIKPGHENSPVKFKLTQLLCFKPNKNQK